MAGLLLVGKTGSVGERRVEYAAEQIMIAEISKFGKNYQIAQHRMNAGKRIDLKEMRLGLAVGADVDASAISAAEHAPGIKRDLCGLLCLGIVDEFITYTIFILLFIIISITAAICLVVQYNFHDADDARICSAAGNADGEFSAGEIVFDEHRLIELAGGSR